MTAGTASPPAPVGPIQSRGIKKGRIVVNKVEQLQEVSVGEMASVDGGGIWFPIIFAVVRFGLANADHNGFRPSKPMTNFELLGITPPPS